MVCTASAHSRTPGSANNATCLDNAFVCIQSLHLCTLINPRRACARVTVVVLCVCVSLSVYPSVPALAASKPTNNGTHRINVWSFEKTFR